MMTNRIFIMVILFSLPVMTSVHAQTGSDSPFERSVSDIKLLEAYFGTSDTRLEVEPGDRNVPLTIVFSAVGSSDITGVKGYLALPSGFSSADGPGDIIESENIDVAAAGRAFSLTFFVDIDKNNQIQQYPGTVKVTYSKVREYGVRELFFNFEFKLTGKGILNVKAENPFLKPSTNNPVTVIVSNQGTAPIANADILLENTQTSVASTSQSITNLENVVFDQNHWNIGTVESDSQNSFSFSVYIPQDLADKTLHAPVSITYFDAHGNQIKQSRTVDFIIGPANAGSVLKISSPPYITTGIIENLVLDLTNLSGSKLSDISISIKPNSEDVQILQDTKWYINEIKPLAKANLEIPIFAANDVGERAVLFDLSVQYTHDDSTVVEKQNIGVYMKGLIDPSIMNVDVIKIAEKQTIIGEILNQGNTDGLFSTVTVEPLDNSNIKKSSQYLDEIETNSPTPFNIPIEFVGEPTVGEHRVLITLKYKDSLRQDHVISKEATIYYNEVKPVNTNDYSQLSLVAVIAVAVGIAGILYKKGKIKIPVTKKIQKESS